MKEKLFSISKNFWVQKHKQLHYSITPMKSSEFNFFVTYLSKINKDDVGTRCITFSLEEYGEILGLKQLNKTRITKVVESLLEKKMTIREKDGGVLVVSIFSKCEIFKIDNVWHMKMLSAEECLEYLFEYKGNYIQYQLGNVLGLSSIYHKRMYELLKPYEKVNDGIVRIDIEEIKSFLYLGNLAHSEYDYLRRQILEPSRKALLQHTDITFTYEKIRSGLGGRTTAIRFYIKSNISAGGTENSDKADMYLPIQENVSQCDTQKTTRKDNANLELEAENALTDREQVYMAGLHEKARSRILAIKSLCGEEFTAIECGLIHDKTNLRLPSGDFAEMYDMVQRCYQMLLVADLDKEKFKEQSIRNRLKYFLKIIETE